MACGTLFSPCWTLLFYHCYSIFGMLLAKEDTIYLFAFAACTDFFCLLALRCLDAEGRVDTAITSYWVIVWICLDVDSWARHISMHSFSVSFGILRSFLLVALSFIPIRILSLSKSSCNCPTLQVLGIVFNAVTSVRINCFTLLLYSLCQCRLYPWRCQI